MAKAKSNKAPKKQAPVAEGLVRVHFVGDGSLFIEGFSTDPYVTTEVDAEKAAALIAEGLFEEGEAPARPDAEDEPADQDGNEPDPDQDPDGSDDVQVDAPDSAPSDPAAPEGDA